MFFADVVFVNHAIATHELYNYLWQRISLKSDIVAHFTWKPNTIFNFVDHYTIKLDTQLWNSMYVNEPISLGQVAYFELFVEKKVDRFLIGAAPINDTKYTVDGDTHMDNYKSIFLSSYSLYTKGQHDRREFINCKKVSNNSTLGIFFDLRKKNGKMYYVVDGFIQGLMYKDVTVPMYPGFSTVEPTAVTLRQGHRMPQDWLQLDVEQIGFSNIEASQITWHGK